MDKGEYPVHIRDKETGKRKQVATAYFNIYDTVSEAIGTLGEAETLKLINAGTQTNEMNRVRGIVRDGPGKKVLEKKAWDSLGAEDFAQVAAQGADGAAFLQKLIAERVAQFEKEAKEEAAKIKVTPGGDEDDADDSDD